MGTQVHGKGERLFAILGLTQTLRTLGVLLYETLRVGEASRREGVLAVAFGKPQSVYDKLSFLAIFA
ncbi:hypothetical protein FACHB389_15945 [Nostoc calcicola FACHB-389]|nr:hypothetical protein [Nostoc calcicola FACHB-3891]MDZ8062510.1 hypothetical protein [Nostoc sp. EkiNYC01]OKH34338.1 hypothetical protein FACHB389_15945 [Nostoc calcicola FACHB-389]